MATSRTKKEAFRGRSLIFPTSKWNTTFHSGSPDKQHKPASPGRPQPPHLSTRHLLPASKSDSLFPIDDHTYHQTACPLRKAMLFSPSLVDLCTGPTGFPSLPLPLAWTSLHLPARSPLLWGHYDSNDNPHHFPDPPAISAPTTGPRRRMHTHTHVTRHLSKHANRPKLLRTGLLACLSKSLKINANRTHSPLSCVTRGGGGGLGFGRVCGRRRNMR